MVILLVGTTGSGKTTVGKELARQLGWRFVEADDYHPQSNIDKMIGGAPLNDVERLEWLDALRSVVDEIIDRGENAVVVAAALTETHRAKLRVGDGVTLVYLKGGEDIIRGRVRRRRGHFAGEAILDDQFARLQEPVDAIVVEIKKPPALLAQEIRGRLGLGQRSRPGDSSAEP